MTPLDDLNARFVYKGESSRIDNWRILKGDGRIEGDCEDYALTLIWLMEGRSLFRFWLAIFLFKYRIWHCASPRGVGHAIIFHDGKWIDNIQRRWVAAEPKSLGYKLRYPMIPPLVVAKMLVAKVFG
mgnify:CR=1 FL=1